MFNKVLKYWKCIILTFNQIVKKPGGLDIPSLLGTATGLIAGLLAGEENFGKVLGSYIGVAVDGFSGGGGAVCRYNICIAKQYVN